jgi:Flp pilus assembly protein TadG
MHVINWASRLGGKVPGSASSSNRIVRRSRGETGSTMVEFAMVLPIFLLLATGMSTFGIALNQYLELNNAVAVGAQYLSIDRANTTDPCADASQKIYNAAPFLSRDGITLTYVLNGTTYGPFKGTTANTCNSSTTSTGAAGNLVRTEPAEVIATYPCTLGVYGANFVPGCMLHAQVTEIVQ